MSNAGSRDRKIVFKTAGPSKSPTGEMTNAPGDPIATAWASVNYGKGSERRQSAAESAEVTATARVLTTSSTLTINASHVAELDGATWNVAGNVPWGRRERDITITRKG